MNIIETENKHTSGVYVKQNFAIVRGSGASLFDEDGNEYIDCSAGHGVANLGHAHPKIAAALADQATKLITLFETFPNDQRAALMEKLTALTPGLERVFFCNSGTEAVEAAIKFSRLATRRTGIIAAMRGFHGRSYGSLSATYNKKYREGFEPLVPGFSHVPFNNPDALEKAVSAETAAVILEAVQGEGGVYPASADYLQAARRICDERGALLIVDEIQSGFGRTGKMFAYQHSGITPDILCVAKSLAGGVPIGAALLGTRVQNLTPGAHGSTFGGNPLASTAGLTTLNIIEQDKLLAHADQLGQFIRSGFAVSLQGVAGIKAIRGQGLMIGIELDKPCGDLVKLALSKGLLINVTADSVIRLLPPLILSQAEAQQLIDILSPLIKEFLQS